MEVTLWRPDPAKRLVAAPADGSKPHRWSGVSSRVASGRSYDHSMHPLLDALTATALLALFALAEQLRRNGVSTQGTRLVVHVVGAGVAACFPLYLGLPDVV